MRLPAGAFCALAWAAAAPREWLGRASSRIRRLPKRVCASAFAPHDAILAWVSESPATVRQVPFSSKLAFGVGQFAEGLKNTAFALFVLFYYNQVHGLPGTVTGAALFVALLFDAVTDPVAGSLSDNWQGRFGRRHPFMYASALPLGLSFFGLFSPPTGLGQAGLFAWLTTFAILTRGAMTLCHVPHLALGAEMTQDCNERTRIVAYRQFFAALGAAAVFAVGFGWFFAESRGGRLVAENYPPFALLLAALMVVTIWYSALGTQKEVPFLLELAPKAKRNPAVQLWRDLTVGFTNRSFRWLFLGVLVVFVMAGVNSALDLYMLEYFWELAGIDMLWVLMAAVLGLIVGAFFTHLLLRRAEKRLGLLLGTGVWAVCQVAPVTLRLLDLLPANGDFALFCTLFGFKFVQGVILQQAYVAFGSMMADVADEHELQAGERQEGVFFGAVAFSAKATSGFGTLIGGVGLDVIGWPRGEDGGVSVEVPAETLVDLGILYGPVVAGFSVAAIWCFTRYDLTRARHARVREALRVRRRGRERATAPTGTFRRC